jgi:cyclopropane fatty-acyl-phospholipid synthase-like methyltransferase
MINNEKIRNFWDSQAEKYGKMPYESIANLEENPEMLKLKIEIETQKVFSFIQIHPGMTVLDLGAGVGQWSFRFAERGAQAYAVDYSSKLFEIAQREADKRGIKNVTFILNKAQQFSSSIRFDLIFISGLLIYLNDRQCSKLINNIPGYSKKGTVLILRDGTGIAGRYEINDRYSENLNAYYSATYRTRETYIQLFKDIDFALISDEDMFEEGSPLNKYPETRLRLYIFKRVV